MIRLSVNVNKVATLRNSRGGACAERLDAVASVVAAGAPGITVHPRADAAAHHAARRPRDRRACCAPLAADVEFNIEGDPRPDLLDLVHEVRPDQCTLVPVVPGEITSQAGWRAGAARDAAAPASSARSADRRHPRQPVRRSRAEPFAGRRRPAPIGSSSTPSRSRERSRAAPTVRASRSRRYAEAAELAHSLGLAVNAGHDLDLDNLVLFRELPHLDEVSIGHAIISRAVFVGLETVVREYLEVLGRS